MKDINRLAGQTLGYGLGTIVPRFLHYFVLTAFYTRVFNEDEYGVITELYAYMVLLLVVLTYGMETGFFRFSNSREDKDRVYSTAVVSLFLTSALFLILTNVYIVPISKLLLYQNHPEYIRYSVAILALDSFTAIPFARLRLENRPLRFSVVKLFNVAVTIIMVLFFLKVAPDMEKRGIMLPGWLYNPKTGVGYVFMCNLAASFFTLLMLLPELFKMKLDFSFRIWKKMIYYSFPLLISGLGGSINDALDKMILKRLTPGGDGLGVVGQYGASYKLAVLMSLFIQMFRFAVEPYFFEKAGKEGAKQAYAEIMKYFIIFCLIIYLGINLYIAGFQYFLGRDLRESLGIVPIVSMGYMLYGIFVNLSVWYKINDMTKYGAILTLIGAVLTIAINLIFVPIYGYIASAWAHIACYGIMVLGSFMLCRIFYPIPYETMKILIYILISVIIVIAARNIPYGNTIIEILVNTIFIGLFVLMVEKKEKALSRFFNKS